MRASILIFAILLFGCAHMMKPSAAAAESADLFYRSKCAACHRVYAPKDHTYRTLQDHVTKYGKGLSGEERMRLLEYLKKNAKEERQ